MGIRDLSFQQNPHFSLKEGSAMLSLCLFLGMGAFIVVPLTNCIYSSPSEYTWQNGYMPHGSVTTHEGFLSVLGGTGGELAGTKPHGILLSSLEMHAAAWSCLGCRYSTFEEKESKC